MDSNTADYQTFTSSLSIHQQTNDPRCCDDVSNTNHVIPEVDMASSRENKPFSEQLVTKSRHDRSGFASDVNLTDVDATSSLNSDDKRIEISTSSNFDMGRNLGFVSSVSFIVGTIVGSGIFISPKGVLEGTGSVGLSLVVWAGAGLIALMGGLCYSELGTLVGKSGGEYAYIQRAMGNVMAFLFTWVSVLVVRTSSLAIMTLTLAQYVATFFSDCADTSLAKTLIATIACMGVGIINCYSTQLAARVQVLTTALKVLALMLILVGGIYNLARGKTSELATGFQGSTHSPSIIALAFYDALWAYDGWNNLNYVTEEVKNPSVNLPRSNIAAVLLVTVLYCLVNISYLTEMTSHELLAADAVGVLWGDRLLRAAGVIIPLCVVISTFGSSNGTAFAGSRTIFAAARDENLPDVLSYIHVKKRTPQPSMVFTVVIAVVMVVAGDISSLIDFFSFTAWLFYGLTFTSLLIMRCTLRDQPRPYKVPIVIPLLMVLVSVYLVVAPIVQSPQIEFLYAFLFVLAGLLFYIPFVRCKVKVPGTDHVTVFIQLLLEVSPTQYTDRTQ